MRLVKGFTLVELMIVVVIIGVLVVLAVPAFSEYRARSADASAKSDVKSAIQAFVSVEKR